MRDNQKKILKKVYFYTGLWLVLFVCASFGVTASLAFQSAYCSAFFGVLLGLSFASFIFNNRAITFLQEHIL